MDKKEMNDIIINCLREVLLEADLKGVASGEAIDESTHLLGRRSILDSLNLVKLLVSTEQKLQEDYGYAVTIADERAMSQEKSPFRTVGTLAEYVHMLVEEEKSAHEREKA